MVYLYVLVGSFFGLCAILGARLALRNRSIRKFVRSIKVRATDAAGRQAPTQETTLVKPRRGQRIAAADLQEVTSLVRKAERLAGQEKIDEAERCYIQALTIHPGAYDVQADLARLYIKSGRDSKAEAIYKDLVTKRKDIACLSNLGLAYYRQGKFAEACAAYKEALSRDPNNSERQYALGRAHIAAAEYADGASLLEKASARLSRDTELLHLLAECYLCLGYKERAEETYRRINRLQPYDENVKEKISSLAKA